MGGRADSSWASSSRRACSDNYLRERKSLTWKRAFSKGAKSAFASTYVMLAPLTDVTANLTPGPALTVRRETSAVPISVNEPITFQESDCAFTAVVHKPKRDTHSLRPKTKDVRADVVLKPSTAILPDDAGLA